MEKISKIIKEGIRHISKSGVSYPGRLISCYVCGKEFTIANTTYNSLKGDCRCYKCSHNGNQWKHGMRKTKEYSSRAKMKGRCTKEKQDKNGNYLSRGIKFCKRRENFENFFDDMGLMPEGKNTIDRIDVNGNYEPGNCRWADMKTQNNNKRNSVRFNDNGVMRTASEIKDIYNSELRVGIIYRRLTNGRTIENSLDKNINNSIRGIDGCFMKKHV